MEVIFSLCPAKQWNLWNHEWNKWMKHVYLPLSVIFFLLLIQKLKSGPQHPSGTVGGRGPWASPLTTTTTNNNNNNSKSQTQ